jgi:hypothetical protein
MKKIFLMLVIISSAVFGDGVWDDTTKPLDVNEVNEALKEYKNGYFDDVKLEDTFEEKSIYFKSDLLNLGIKTGMSTYSETLSNKIGSKESSYNAYEIKLILSKDFELWHNQFEEYSRLYLIYDYSQTQDSINFSGYGLGYIELMKYFTFYKLKGFSFYPALSLEIGLLDLEQHTQTIKGYYEDLGVSVISSYGHNYEISLDLNYKNITWDYPVDGVEDIFDGIYIGVGFNYRFVDGDF